MIENFKEKLSFLAPYLPYGVVEPWDDLNPKLYHAVHIYWLKFYGMWFNSYSPKSYKFWLQLLYTMIVLWLVCFLPGIGEVVYLLRRRDNIGDVAEGLAGYLLTFCWNNIMSEKALFHYTGTYLPTFLFVLYLFLSEMYTYVKVAVFWWNRKKIFEILSYMHCSEFKPQEEEHKVIYRKSIKTARFVMSYYSAMCVGAVSVGMIIPLTEHFDILPTNVEYPYIDVYSTPMYQILYFHHVYYKPATCIIDGVMDTILAAFITVAIGQIEILTFNFRNFDMIAERKLNRVKQRMEINASMTKALYMKAVLQDCMKHHNCIIRYVSMIESAFSVASALQFMLSVMVLCLVGIQFLSIENPTSHPMQIVWMAIYLTCMLIEVFILCWFGDELIWKSMDFSLAAYESPWLKIDRETSMIVIIFLERCKRPLRVTAGKIFTLSLDTYTVLINWSYKAFAVMRNMKK